MRILKYCPLVFLVAQEIALLILRGNSGVSYNLSTFGSKFTLIEWLFWAFPVMLILEVLIRWKCELKQLKQVQDENDHYFDRIGTIDRLRWLVFENYMRKRFGTNNIDEFAY